MTTAYVSSTYKDLKDYRTKVRTVLGLLGIDDVAMEYYVAEPKRPLERCLHDAGECDLYIGIFAWRYGYIPDGESKSITELEYRMAIKAGKPALIFLLSEDTPWPLTLADRDRDDIERLREELAKTHVASFFSNPDSLGTQVAAAIHRHLDSPGTPLSAQALLSPEVKASYYTRLAQEHGRLDLDTISPSQFEEQLRIQLSSVFVEPDVREELPPLDLPKNFQRWLVSQESLADSDFPVGLEAADLERLRWSYQQRPRRKVFDLLAGEAGRKVVLLGDPGSGKSTLIRYLALSLADPATSTVRTLFADCVPILIELKAYESTRSTQPGTTFLEFFDYLGRTQGLGIEQAPLQQYLASDGRAVALFDGLDEIFDLPSRGAVMREIAKFAADYPKVDVVVTSRIIGYSNKILADAGFTQATIQDLSLPQIDEFLGRWYDLSLRDRPGDVTRAKQRLLTAIAESRSISEMAGNPLLLTILAIIGRHRDLPRERWKVYEYAADVLVDRWDVERELRDQSLRIGVIGADEKKELLRRVARLMQAGTSHGGNYLTKAELRSEFENYLKDRFPDTPDTAQIAEAMIRQFRDRNFILSNYGSELYGFVHRAFLEFFCAESFRWQFEKTKKMDIDRLKTEVFGLHWSQSAWREVLRLIAGTIDDEWTSKLIIYLTDEVNLSWPWKIRDNPPRNIALAAQCAAEKQVVTKLEAATKRVMVRIVQLLEHSILDRETAANRMIASEIMPAVAAIGPSWPGREIYLDWYLARGARLVGSPISGLASRIAVCLYPNEPRLLRAFLSSIRTIKDNQLAIPLLERLDDFTVTDAETLDELIGDAAADTDARVREAAIRALTHSIAQPQVRAICLDLAGQDEDNDVREATIRALAQLAVDKEICAFLLGRAAADPHWSVRIAAVRVLADLPADVDIRGMLLDRAVRDADYRVRESAVEALARMPVDADIRALLFGRATETGNKETADRALAGLPADVEVHTLLLDRAEHAGYGAVRQAAIQALAGLPADPATKALLLTRATDDNDPPVRKGAIQALGAATPDPDIRGLLLDRAGADHDAQVREAAVRVLGSWPLDAGVRAILLDRASDDEDDKVREAAIEALTRQPADPDIRTLLLDRARHDHDDKVREAAIEALTSNADDPEVRGAIFDLAVNDGSWTVRRSAIRAVASLPVDADVRALLFDRAGHDEDNDVREAAVRALAHLPGDAQMRALLLERAADSEPNVRDAAARALARMPADPDIRALLLGRATETGNKEAADRALAGLPASIDARALLLDRAEHAEHGAVRQAAIQALARMPADPATKALLLTRATDDNDPPVRKTAVEALAAAPAISMDPEVHALLLDRAAHDEDEAVWLTALDIILMANSGDDAAEFVVSSRASKLDNNWARQLQVRVLACSAKFTPVILPTIAAGTSWPSAFRPN
jgi:HEAT repeat protein